MFFLAPWMLLGVLAAAVPIAIHFFFRSRYRTVPWAAMQFLLASLEQTSRRIRFQELLLLLLRIAVLLL
ncbi:MAG TPA: BatA domain-containing protein, partial [Gemmataceae bacterium]|nr:BatA domain-containing protein [Gemmataceae bacterium]